MAGGSSSSTRMPGPEREVEPGRREVDRARDEPLAVGGDDDTQRAHAVEPARQTFDEALGHVLDRRARRPGSRQAGRRGSWPAPGASGGRAEGHDRRAGRGRRAAPASAARRARSRRARVRDDLDPARDPEVAAAGSRRTAGSPAGTSRAPTTSTAPAAMAASGCSAAAPQTTIGVGAAAMIRSMVSSPPPKSSRSTSTVAGRSSLTRSSARCGVARATGHDEARAGDQSCSSWRSRTWVPATRTTLIGRGATGAGGHVDRRHRTTPTRRRGSCHGRQTPPPVPSGQEACSLSRSGHGQASAKAAGWLVTVRLRPVRA